MRSVKSLLAAGAASLLSTMAFAADLAIAPPPMYSPPPPADFGGWYLRGDIGMTNQRMKSLDNPDPNAALFTSVGMGFDSSTLFDVGVGYQFNNWFRADVTGQWRGKANFHGSQFTDAFARSASVEPWIPSGSTHGRRWCVRADRASPLLTFPNGAGPSRAVLLCAAWSRKSGFPVFGQDHANRSPRQRLVKVNGR